MQLHDNIVLKRPTLEMQGEALNYRDEHFRNKENIIHGSELLDQIEDYAVWLNMIVCNTNKQTVSKDWVVTDTFFAIRESDHKIIGVIDLRHTLNDFLKDFGHCGYSVRPSERKKGYATQMLKQLIIQAKEIGMKELQLSVMKDNIASIKTILLNGGVYTRSFQHENQIAEIYCIALEKKHNY